MYTALVLIVETDEIHTVPGKFATREEALEAAKQVASRLLELYGEGYTWDFIIRPLE